MKNVDAIRPLKYWLLLTLFYCSALAALMDIEQSQILYQNILISAIVLLLWKL